MRATHSFILGIDLSLLSVASAATGNHWHQLTPQAMLAWLPDARWIMCVQQSAGQARQPLAIGCHASGSEYIGVEKVHIPCGHRCPFRPYIDG